MSDEAAYMDHRTRLASATAADELLARVRVRKAPAESMPAAPATAPQALPEEGSKVGRVAKDIALGATVEVPRAVLKGVRDAYQNTIDIGDELGGWLEQGLHLPGLKISGEGIDVVGSEELQQLRAEGNDVASHMVLPDLDPPKTVTGGLIKGVAQFLTGMKGANKLLDAANIGKMAGAAGYTRTAVQGAIANFTAFDPHQQRLSNLIEQVPALKNPVTAYLSSQPDDNAAEGRFKNSLEGLGLGVAADGFFKSVKMLRNVAFGKNAAIQAQTVLETAPSIPQDAFRELGDDAAEAGSKLVQVKAPKTVEPVAGGEPPAINPEDLAKTPAEKPEVFINFARIDTADDVKRAMQEMAEANSAAITAKQRGVQTFEQTKLNAAQKDAWASITARREGESFNAETAVAARQLWAASGEKLTALAKMAADTPSEANLFAFRKMLTVHNSIQQEVIAARTETARALGSWRIPVGGDKERLRDITSILEQNGGNEVSRELASRISALTQSGMYKELDEVVKRTAYAKTRDAVLEGWINGLLSNPTTHIVNTMSNSIVMGLRMGERAVASKISSMMGDEGGVAAGEAAQQWFGLTQGLKDAFRYAYKAAKTGESGYGLNKLETAREGSITSEAFNLSNTGWLGRGVDALGSVIRTPGRLMTGEDEFFKTLGYRMEVNAQAMRQATNEVSAGTLAADSVKQRVAELIANPPENIRMLAVDAAMYQTFTNAPGNIAKRIGGFTTDYPALKVIMPFVRTPANIMRFTFERTPLAPALKQFRAGIAAGGARRDLALAQIGIGTATMMSAADLTMSGQLSGQGPLDRGTKAAMVREGWQPYSLKVGDRWYAINRLDPVGSLLTMSADVVDMLTNAQHEALEDADTEKLAVATTVAIAGNVLNKTYLSGLASVFEAMGDPPRYSESMIQRMVGSVVPAGVANITRQMDPYQREVYSMMDAIRARTPGLSDSLPPRLNLWGEPVTKESGFGKAYDAFSPIYSLKPGGEPIDAELIKQEANIGLPKRRTSFDGATVDLTQYPKAYSRFIELSGNALKHPAWGMGAKDLLNQIVEGKHPLSQVYQLRSDGPDGGKVIFIKDLLRQYQDMARKQVLQEFPEVAGEVETKKATARALRYPTIG
jgi:hypothetical protein